MDIITPLDTLAAALIEAGLDSGTDPSKLNPPCAWVHARTLEVDTLAGGATVQAQIDLTVPGWSLPIALAELQRMLALALTVVAPDGRVELDTGIELNDGTILPGFRVPVNLEI